MQLGTRWTIGATPPANLPAPLIEAVAEVERELAAIDGVDTVGWRWTLTYLEGRPIAQLDDGTTLAYLPASGSVQRTDADA
jgi:hypothetical protein